MEPGRGDVGPGMAVRTRGADRGGGGGGHGMGLGDGGPHAGGGLAVSVAEQLVRLRGKVSTRRKCSDPVIGVPFSWLSGTAVIPRRLTGELPDVGLRAVWPSATGCLSRVRPARGPRGPAGMTRGPVREGGSPGGRSRGLQPRSLKASYPHIRSGGRRPISEPTAGGTWRAACPTGRRRRLRDLAGEHCCDKEAAAGDGNRTQPANCSQLVTIRA